MLWVRSQLARIACGWLALHLSLLVSVPTTLCATTSTTAIGEECTCEHGEGQACPMHHAPSSSASSTDADACSCGSAADPLGELAAALIGPLAVVGTSAEVVAPLHGVTAVFIANSAALDSSSVPDAPPPRG